MRHRTDEVYELAKRRGMDFVTITDHDTIAGALELGHLPDTFLSEELTVWFAGEPQAVHVLCYGITPDDHDWLQAHNDSVENCAAYIQEHAITAALAHPFYAVQAPLTARHRRRLAQLFRFGRPATGRAPRSSTCRRSSISKPRWHRHRGSDDHAGIDIGRTFTETPRSATPGSSSPRAGRPRRGPRAQGSAAKWTHAAMALAIRSLEPGDAGGGEPGPKPMAVLRIVERVMREGDARRGRAGTISGPTTRARCCGPG